MSEEVDAYVVKAELRETQAKAFVFANMKTMYGGKRIATGDTVFIFASETEGGRGLVARGVVTKMEAVPLKKGVERQTPRVNVEVKRSASARRPFGRAQLKAWRGVDDASGEAELDFKFYRQATNKIGGISAKATRVLMACF